MSGELVERVARALEEHVRRVYFNTDVITSLPPDWEPWVGSAKAAITAVLDAIAEPSEAMQERGGEQTSGNDDFAAFDFPGEAIRVWRAMIAALRKEIEP